MLAVLAALAMPGMRAIRGPLQGRLIQDRIDARAPRGMNLGQIRRDAALGHLTIQIIRGEQLHRVRPQQIKRGLRARMAFRGSVAGQPT